MFAGRQLEDAKTFSEQGLLESQVTYHLILR